MNLGRSPGCDRLSVAFFQKFWQLLGEILLDAYNYSFQQGQLHLSARRGLITLIPKKTKICKELKSGGL